ncbi:hypothetical protein K1T71_001657 [Dendrolimus kikuchii]|uniref:Uncharacterized protein n=1 Tax=Dendrolimus kikuchii TaxID=765133 RepID=A0ACC1DEA9_9NEOP|nr:hypothetical protein K1T71_001657 [Dendrolimus kikuchii]
MSQVEQVKCCIENAVKVIRMYDWLLDLYVLDYFVDNHWSKLPESWQQNFIDMDPQHLGQILNGQPTNHIFPLSFLALIKSVNAFNIPRRNNTEITDIQASSFKSIQIIKTSKKNKTMTTPTEIEDIGNDLTTKNDTCGNNPKLKNLFLKHVNLKKRHEISLMAELVHEVASKSDCDTVIDFGSGLGHLVRMLAYKYDLNVAGIEGQSQLIEGARKLDKELEYTASIYLTDEAMAQLRRPNHFNSTLSCHSQLATVGLSNFMSNCGLIGLHPCGDLGPSLIKYFVRYPQAKFVCVVGCCYMKLTCGPNSGYPLSDFVMKLDSHLSYPSREIACHAIEVYCDRLRKGNYEDLKVHAYRAALERILINHNPELKHAQVRSIKHSDKMTFERYCSLALERLNIPLPTSTEIWLRAEEDLQQWRQIVIVYTLRLTLAPLVETVILLDRMLYLIENGASCEIKPVFDPTISPRNHVIIARR